MNEELQSFRFLLVPVALFVAVVFYRSCWRTAETPAVTPQAAKPAVTTGGVKGLQIEQAPPSGLGGGGRSTTDYPPGLDAARIQYLVEIDRQFSEPKVAFLAKKFDEKDPVQKAMLKLGFAEKLGDGSIGITRDGNMSLSLIEEETGWRFAIAKRVFDDVMFIDRVEDDRYKATFHWHWQPNAAGNLLHVETKQFAATAEFAGGQGSWVLSGWIAPPVEPEKTEKSDK
jgi:hypothetical protein